MMKSTLVLLALSVTACGGTAPAPRAATAPAKVATPAPKQRPDPERARLIAALHAVPPPGPVLGALDDRAHADLERAVRALSAEQKNTIVRGGGAAAAAQPLVYLALGGDAPAAYFALATRHAGAAELVRMRKASGENKLDDLARVASELRRRAAAEWLRDRAVDVASPGLDAELCDAIDRVASALGRLELRRRAREMAAKLDGSAEHELAVARAAAWQLDVGAARAALSAARVQHADAGAARAVERLIGKARVARDALNHKKLGVAESVRAARALIALEQPARAAALLAPERGAVRSNLALAAALALATTARDACAGMAATLSESEICAAARPGDARVTRAADWLDAAWKSGGGRDDRAIETWLGMNYFLPWAFDLPSGDQQRDQNDFRSRARAFSAAARDAATASHTFDGLVLFLDTISAGFEASTQKKPGARTSLKPAERSNLERRAIELAKRSPGNRFAQAGLLGVAALLAQDEDVEPLLGALPAEVDATLRRPRVELEAWSVLAHGAGSPNVDRVRSGLANLVDEDVPRSLKRAEDVLLMAEFDAALTHLPKAYAVLAQISGQLTGNGVPPDLRWRASVDLAGSLARAGKVGKAKQVLAELLAPKTPRPPKGDRDVVVLARCYAVVLDALGADGKQRAKALAELEQLGKSSDVASGSVWRMMWQRELEYQVKKAQCGARKACLAHAARRRRPSVKWIDATDGAEQGRIARFGVASMGTLKMSFSFTRTGKLDPEVGVDLELPAVQFPPIASKR